MSLISRYRVPGLALLLVGVVVPLACGRPDSNADTTTVRSALAAGPPGSTVGGFVLLASGALSVDDRSASNPQITGGDVGAAGIGVAAGTPTLVIGSDAKVDLTRVTVGQRTVLRDRAVVGVVSATQLTAPFATFSSLTPFSAPPVPPPIRSFTAGTAALTVNSGQTVQLAAGKRGAVVVNGTLELTGGLYELASLTLGNDARLTARARSVVRISQGLRASDRVRIAVLAPLTAGDLRFIVAGVNSGTTASVVLGNDDNITGLYLGSAAVTAGDRLVALGAIAARTVTIGHDAKITFQTGFECNLDSACNDAATCTNDTCTDAQCAHAAVANGTVCNDGNACTQSDSCQAGACVGSNPKVCAPLDQCHVAGTCAPATGVCSNPVATNGTTCNDANSCTLADVCQAGVCTGAAQTCSTPQTCNAIGACALKPVMDCVVANPDGTFVAFFGYQNSATANVSVPVGVNNSFSPGLADRRQPTTFVPVGRDFWVTVHFDGTPLTWTLGGSQATAASTSPPCPPFPAGGEDDSDGNGDLTKFHPLAAAATPPAAQIPQVASNNLFPRVTLPQVPHVEPAAAAAAAPGQQEAAAVADQPILEALIPADEKAARSTEVVLVNNTDLSLSFVEGEFEGEGEVQPPSGIAPQSYGDLESGSNGFLQGTGGHVRYSFNGVEIRLDWDNPFIGDNTYSSSLTGANAAGFTLDRVGGEGNRATVFFILRRTSTAATNCPFGTHQWMVDSLRSAEEPLTGFDKAVGFLSTPAKILTGVGKWASTGCFAPRVVGRVVQRAHSTDDFYTIDVVLDEFDGAFLSDSNKAVRIEVPPLIGEVSLPGLLEIEVPNALGINPANVAIKVNGLPAIGSRIVFSGPVFIDHGSFLEVHPITPIQTAPACDQLPPGTPVPLFCNTTLNSFFTWDTGQSPTPMGRADHRACFLTGMRGAFQDPADEVHATLDPLTNNWFLTGAGPGPVHAQARCIDAPSIGPEKSWSQGDPPLSLIAAANGTTCFLTRVAGHFEGAGELVKINDIAQGVGSITLNGFSQQAGVGASARCLTGLGGTDFTFVWNQGTASFPLELIRDFPGCFLQGVTGAFEGGGEEVNISVGQFPAGLAWVLGGASQQAGVAGFASCISP